MVAARLPDLLAASRREVLPIPAEIACGDMRNVPPDSAAWSPLRPGDRWGEPGKNALIRMRLSVPEGWERDRVYLNIVPSQHDGAEGLVYVNGAPFHAIDIYHHQILLNGQLEPGREYELLFEAHIWIVSDQPHIVQQIELLRVDEDAEGIYQDLRILQDAVKTMPVESVDRLRLVRALEGAYRSLDLRDPQSEDYLASVRRARVVVSKAYEGGERGPRPRTVAVGHAHLDLAWMWRVEQTRRKGARTFSTALRLMEQYPDYHFVASQPALYELIREDEPEIYQQVMERVREGRWEPTGASWVEMDCNLTGSESLVRQFLYGKRHFREVLGVDPKILWLPDVFGYSAALPQVMKGCDVDYFMTTKISWNEYNRIPHDTFRWRGIDGTEVLTHMVTVPDDPKIVDNPVPSSSYTYNAKYTPEDIEANWTQYRQKGINDELLYLFGYGDGGGGPTADMQEAALRLVDLPGFPVVEQSSAENFFKRLDERVWNDPDLPLWVGELYLEYHRGTYTSQAWIKRANRQAEVLLHNAELALASVEVVLGKAVSEEERASLALAWKSLMFNQFHDVLPGSSIKEVYEDARGEFEEIFDRGMRMRNAAMQRIASEVATEGPSLVIFNPAPFDRDDPVECFFPKSLPVPPDFQLLREDGERYCLLAPSSAPASGHMVRLLDRPAPPTGSTLTVSREVLENDFFRVELDGQANIRSLFDKRNGREVISQGETANRFIAFEDRPLNWDAWDIQIDYADKPYPVTNAESWEVVEDGPLRAGIEIVRRFGNSTIRQKILIYRDIPRVDFPTHVDWHERQTLLKVAFPVAVNSARATFDIQWGNVERPTHWNTSWDWARFESCAHKWVDLSEGDYGVSLLNDCKYGYDVKGHTMRLTCLRSPINPDPTADQGEHDFTYALLPHQGDWRTDTIRQGYLLNMPQGGAMVADVKDGSLPDRMSLVSCDRPGVVVETVKPAEDGDGIVVRLYEAHNSRGPARLTFAREPASVVETNMLEEPLADLEFEGQVVELQVRPYGIVTLKVRFPS